MVSVYLSVALAWRAYPVESRQALKTGHEAHTVGERQLLIREACRVERMEDRMQGTAQQRLLERIKQRMKAIVESEEYSPKEKRIRAMSQLEYVLETVLESLPDEQQGIVQEVLKLYQQVWV